MVISIHRVIDGGRSPQVIRFCYDSYDFLSAAVNPVNCGAACGTSQAACTDSIKDMVLAPINAVANMSTIVGSMGASTAIKTGAKAAVEGTQMVSKDTIGRAIAKTTMHAGSQASEGVAMELGAATLGEGEFNWQSLDPTGLADIVRAFSHPWCDEP
jgi:hypothetical protein